MGEVTDVLTVMDAKLDDEEPHVNDWLMCVSRGWKTRRRQDSE